MIISSSVHSRFSKQPPPCFMYETESKHSVYEPCAHAFKGGPWKTQEEHMVEMLHILLNLLKFEEPAKTGVASISPCLFKPGVNLHSILERRAVEGLCFF